MESFQRDDRKGPILTRGNVDEIVSAALFLACNPTSKVRFFPSGDQAVDVMRKDISSSKFYLVDLCLTPRLIKTLNDKTRQRAVYLDHHQQSQELWNHLDHTTEGVIRQGISAAGVAHDYLALPSGHEHLVALADHIEYCPSGICKRPLMRMVPSIADEARMLDFA
jgi:hypothetical protein